MRRARPIDFAKPKPRSSKMPRIWLTSAVRWFTRRRRARCSNWISCCSIAFFGTKRMFGWRSAVQIASASFRSFFCRFTNGFTYCGAMILTSCPSASNRRCQKNAPAQASIPLRQGGSASMTSRRLSRLTRRCRTQFACGIAAPELEHVLGQVDPE